MIAAIVWNTGTLAVVLALAVPIVAIVAGFWAKIERAKLEADLKRRMIEKGMTAEDIQRVIESSTHVDEDATRG